MKVRSVPLGPLPASLTRRPDGTMLVRTSAALREYPKRSTERLAFWAAAAPRRAMLSWRGAGGEWESLSYGDALAAVRRIGQALLDRGRSAEKRRAALVDELYKDKFDADAPSARVIVCAAVAAGNQGRVS